MKMKNFYCKSDKTFHYVSEIPKTLRPFIDYAFSSGGYIGDDFKSFNIKFRNSIKKLLPDGYALHSWTRGHYYCNGIIKDNKDRYIYVSVSDVRYSLNEWVNNILIRTMKNDKDWVGGVNHYTDLINFNKDIQKLYKS